MLKIIAINAAATIILLEAFSSTLFKERIQFLFPEYLAELTNFFGRGYPRWHFSQNAKRGFDIAKNSPPVINSSLREAEPYFVFGNNIGCFDETPISHKKYQVYLAGDSFTWGYAPIEQKFGTLLEDMLKQPVAACGVSHTGQIHQFSKFLDITKQLGYYPKNVIVNVYMNDIANDFAHPHTTVIEGFQVDSVFIRYVNDSPVRVEISTEELEERYNKAPRTLAKFGRLDPRKYSASAVLAVEGILKPAARLIRNNVAQTASSGTSGSVYSVQQKESEMYPILTDVALRNRNAITDWINHSKKHDYNLIFADLRTQPIKEDLSAGSQLIDHTFCDYITDKGSSCYSFVDFMSRQYPLQTWSSIRWRNDGHFNQLGNKLYAEFLFKSLQDYRKQFAGVSLTE